MNATSDHQPGDQRPGDRQPGGDNPPERGAPLAAITEAATTIDPGTGVSRRPASELIRNGAPQGLKALGPRPAERFVLTAGAFARLPAALAAEPGLAFLALWAEPGLVHAALLDQATGGALLIVSAPASGGRYAALSPYRPGAVRFERMLRDLWGLSAEGGLDLRPWLDHGRWPVEAPLAAKPVPRPVGPAPQPDLLAAEGEGVHQIPLGPVHGGATGPAHFRFHVQGEAVVRLEQRLGYAHKGTLSLLRGKSPRAAARFAARLSGDSTVAHSWAFAAAAEAATGTTPPPRAVHLRALMAELERIHNHLNDWGAVCAAAGLGFPDARCGALREGVLRAADKAFGHRLMMDRVLPGGVAIDIAHAGPEAILAALEAVEAELPALERIYDGHAALQDRVAGIGVLTPALAARFAAGGVVGRGSGHGFDARHAPGHPPYDTLDVSVKVQARGDVDARLRVRIAELAESIRLARRLLATLPAGETLVALPQGSANRAGEGLALVEGFRGACLHWLRLDDGGLIQGVFMRDPSWLQWPLLEAAMEGTTLADFAVCSRSFNCSVSGVDL